MKLKLFSCLAVLFIILTTWQAQAVNLIAIYNNLPANYRVQIEGTKFDNIIGKPFVGINLPVPSTGLRILVYPPQGKEKVIMIKETESPTACKGIEVEAYVAAQKETTTQKICVTKSITKFLPGKQVDAFQNILLALDSNPTASAGELPFKFGISAWTSTKFPWNQKQIFSPADNDAIKFAKPLTVLQGFAAWGGGPNPRIDHGDVLHLYNNSPFTLYIIRYMSRDQGDLSAYNFEMLVPPYCAVPWASIWLPNVSADKMNSAWPSISEVRIFALKPPVTGELPPGGFEEIGAVGGFELGPTPKDVQEVVDQMNKQVPDFISKVTGQPNLSEFMQVDKLFIGKFVYKLYTNNASKEITVRECDIVNLENTKDFVISGCKEIGKGPETAVDGRTPNYFKLIVNKSADPNKAIELNLTAIPDEKVLE